MENPTENTEPVDDNRPFDIQVSERIQRLPAYLFARLNQLMYQKRRAGDDVIDMGMGNPTDPPADVVIDKLAEAARDPGNHGYSPAMGILNLRREVAARYLKKWGVRLDPESEIITTLGSKEGFSHLCLALIGPGDTAIVPAPTYPRTCMPYRWPPATRSRWRSPTTTNSCRTSTTFASTSIRARK